VSICKVSLPLFCSVSPLYVYMGGFCCMRPLVGVTHVAPCLGCAGFFVSATGWPCFFCRLRSPCSFAVDYGRGRGRADRLRPCFIPCRWYVGRGGRDAESTRGAGARRCGSGRFLGFCCPHGIKRKGKTRGICSRSL